VEVDADSVAIPVDLDEHWPPVGRVAEARRQQRSPSQRFLPPSLCASFEDGGIAPAVVRRQEHAIGVGGIEGDTAVSTDGCFARKRREQAAESLVPIQPTPKAFEQKST